MLIEREDNAFFNNLADFLKDVEDWKDELYYDSVQLATIGYGFYKGGLFQSEKFIG